MHMIETDMCIWSHYTEADQTEIEHVLFKMTA